MRNGEVKIPVKGVSWRELSKGDVEVGDSIEFVREAKNPYDPNAVRVLAGDDRIHVGYLDARVAESLSESELSDLNKYHKATITHIGCEDGVMRSIDVSIGRL